MNRRNLFRVAAASAVAITAGIADPVAAAAPPRTYRLPVYDPDGFAPPSFLRIRLPHIRPPSPSRTS